MPADRRRAVLAQELQREVGVRTEPDLGADDVQDAAVGSDDVRVPAVPDVLDLDATVHIEPSPDRAVQVGEDRITQRVPLGEGGLAVYRVGADADRLRTDLGELLGGVPESAVL